MRILLISDIHGNGPALRAVRAAYDTCLFIGDAVDYGPDTEECMDWLRANAAHGVRGNHDHGAAQRIFPMGSVGFRYLTGVTRPRTVEALTDDDRQYLSRLPLTKYLTLDGKRYLLVHASPWDPMEEYAPPDEAFWAPRVKGLDVDYVVVGHTHVPYTLKVGTVTVVNPGSIGLPRDGDPRGAYGIVEDGEVQLHRFEYPISEVVDAIKQGPLPSQAKSMMEEVYTTGKLKLR